MGRGRRRWAGGWQRAAMRWAVAVVLVAGALVLYAFGIEPFWLEVRPVTIRRPTLPPALDGMRLVLVADAHLTEYGKRERAAVAAIAEARPELVIVAGDLIQNSYVDANARRWTTAMEAWLHDLVTVAAPPLGVWVVRGNADIAHFSDQNSRFVEAVARSGAHLLVNRAVPIQRTGGAFWLAGTDFADWPAERLPADFRLACDLGNCALASGPSPTNSYTFLADGQSSAWRDYEVRLRMRCDDPRCGIGVLWGSQLRDGPDRYYRLRAWEDEPTFRLMPKGAEVLWEPGGGDVRLPGEGWLHVRVRVTVGADGIRMAARLWPDGTPEPEGWQLSGVDPAASFPRGGIGFWTAGPGQKFFDDVAVQALDGTLLFADDFERGADGTDPIGWLDFGSNSGQLAAALLQVPPSERGSVLLLAHSPDIIDEAQAAGLPIVLSGHTHGGQVRLPFLPPPTINTTLGRRYADGLFAFGGTDLLITKGLGTRTIPVRLAARPEIMVVTLTRN